MAVISEIEKKLKAMNEEIVKMELDSIYMIEKNSRRRLLAELQAWKRRKEDIVQEFRQTLVALLSDCSDALGALHRLVTSDVDARFDKILALLANPCDVIEDNDNGPTEPEQVVEAISEFEIRNRVFGNTIFNSRALLGEIKQELERSGKRTVVEFLRVPEYLHFFPFEWTNLYELRLRTIETAILVSKLMVQFICYLGADEQLFKLLKSKIESIKNISTVKCVVAERFVSLIEIAGNTMSQMKLKEDMFFISVDEYDLYNNMISLFYNAVMDLEWIMSFPNVPVTRGLVVGARIRLEGVLGLVLYIMQGVRMKIRKQHHGYWMRMKSVIPKLWSDLEDLQQQYQQGERGGTEAETSGANQGGEIKEEGGLILRRRSRLLNIQEEEEEEEEEAGSFGCKNDNVAGPSGSKNDEEVGDFSGKKDDDEDAGDPSSYKKEDDEEVGDTSARQVGEGGDSSGKKDDEEVVYISGKRVEDAGDPSYKKDDDDEDSGDPSSYKKDDDDEEVGDSSATQVGEVGDSSGKQVEEAGDPSRKKDEEEGGQSSGKRIAEVKPWEEQYDEVASPPMSWTFGEPW